MFAAQAQLAISDVANFNMADSMDYVNFNSNYHNLLQHKSYDRELRKNKIMAQIEK